MEALSGIVCIEGTRTLSWCRTHQVLPTQPFEACVSRQLAILQHSRAVLSLRPKRETCSIRKPASCGRASAPKPAGRVIPRKQRTRRRQSTRYGSNAHMLS
jgi:hypothetical protein